MQIIVFTLVAIAVYFAADYILLFIERLYGKPLPNRSIVYFCIFLALILLSFELVQQLLAPV